MSDYERLTSYMQVGKDVVQIVPQRKHRIQAYIDRLFEIEDKIESGELIFKEQYEQLKAENAELKERLEKVVEPPCKIGDILYTVTIVFSDGWVGDTILRRNGFSISETEVTEKNIWSICDLIRRGMAFFSKEAAETRLRELRQWN